MQDAAKRESGTWDSTFASCRSSLITLNVKWILSKIILSLVYLNEDLGGRLIWKRYSLLIVRHSSYPVLVIVE